jgi:hypothetical protein
MRTTHSTARHHSSTHLHSTVRQIFRWDEPTTTWVPFQQLPTIGIRDWLAVSVPMGYPPTLTPMLVASNNRITAKNYTTVSAVFASLGVGAIVQQADVPPPCA